MLKAGSVAPEGTPWADWLEAVKTRTEKDSGGRLKVKVFLGGKLGGEKELLEDTRQGTLQLFGGSSGAVAAAGIPELAALELPYLLSSDAEADFVLERLRERVARAVAARGFELVMWAENGWHGYGVNGRCLELPADLSGLKMRSQESFVHIETFRTYGAAPVEMAVPEVLAALQTGTVDGFSNTPLFAFATSWYSGITHFTETRHVYQPAMLLLSKQWLGQVPEDLRRVLLDRREEQSGRDAVRALTEPLLDNFRAAGKVVCRLTAAQRREWQARARPVWDVFAAKSRANREMLDAILAAKRAFADRR